ncbi:IS3 family transposase [Rhodocytophaga aerolata]|uniref:IS3 family transposase n=1 Tax=Rhodocytophaga aerolata TaxID=455078 RepID=A0ABT8RK58_9BACT|nr:IS3 family transposase [Rhodocytophaga aerolata]MDO1451929.1 IS3 family transposase [Rhodocytophaga aerolata]
MKQFEQHIPQIQLCKWLDLPGSVSYYKRREGKPGAQPSQVTTKLDGSCVLNQQVVERIGELLSGEFSAFGYEYTTHELKKEYCINKKKVYRLMKENNLLLGKVIRTTGKREFVQFQRIQATKPLEYLCWDIKYIWVQGEGRNYYLLSVMNVYSRRIIDWLFQNNIRQMDVITLIKRINAAHQLQGVILRNDNGSQFMAHRVRNLLKNCQVKQEFTHIATPEENSYIEAFHSILEREVIERHEFGSYYEAKQILQRFFEHYNCHRLHRSIGFVTPEKKWQKAMHTIILENLSN